jgi:hypothetical protein
MQAALVAQQSGGHLHAPVRGDTIKTGFVALSLFPQGTPQPQTGLDRGMRTCKAVPLLFQEGVEIGIIRKIRTGHGLLLFAARI